MQLTKAWERLLNLIEILHFASTSHLWLAMTLAHVNGF